MKNELLLRCEERVAIVSFILAPKVWAGSLHCRYSPPIPNASLKFICCTAVYVWLMVCSLPLEDR